MSKIKIGDKFYYCSCGWGDCGIHEFISRGHCFDGYHADDGIYEYQNCFLTFDEAQAYQQKYLKEEILEKEQEFLEKQQELTDISIELKRLKDILIT